MSPSRWAYPHPVPPRTPLDPVGRGAPWVPASPDDDGPTGAPEDRSGSRHPTLLSAETRRLRPVPDTSPGPVGAPLRASVTGIRNNQEPSTGVPVVQGRPPTTDPPSPPHPGLRVPASGRDPHRTSRETHRYPDPSTLRVHRNTYNPTAPHPVQPPGSHKFVDCPRSTSTGFPAPTFPRHLPHDHRSVPPFPTPRNVPKPTHRSPPGRPFSTGLGTPSPYGKASHPTPHEGVLEVLSPTRRSGARGSATTPACFGFRRRGPKRESDK